MESFHVSEEKEEMKPITKVVFAIAGLFLLGAFYFLSADILNFFGGQELVKNAVKNIVSKIPIEEIRKEISVPPPLRAKTEAPKAALTVEGVIEETNRHRAENDLPPLAENTLLMSAAWVKVNDMFLRQYFAHESWAGVGPGDLAENAGYEFLAVGENLALGNFADDKELVQAWMDSPGHRANILNNRYIEIGVSVKKGTFEGRTTWLAVQEFGLPLSVCPEVNGATKGEIDANQAELTNMEAQLNAKRTELENTPRRPRDEYNQKVKEYNVLVEEYNALLQKTKALILGYNAEVQAFNACLNAA